MYIFKRYLVMFLLALLCFFLQTTILPYIKLGAVMPNFLVILTSCYGYIRGGREGVFTGFCCGILCDIFYGSTMGLFALIFVCLGYFNDYIHRLLGDVHKALHMLFILGTDLVYGFICYFCFCFLKGSFGFGYCMGNIILPEMIYTAAFAIPIYYLITSIERKFDKLESRSANKFV